MRLLSAFDALERAYSSGHHGRWSATRRAELVDEAVRSLGGELPGGTALVALGGYGRRSLCPHSDVDLLLLHDGAAPELLQELAGRVFYPLWDAGLVVGHAVRTIAESLDLAAERFDAATALLEARPVVGDAGLVAELKRALRDTLSGDPAAFLRRSRQLRAERRERHGSCGSFLEPDLKESTGGVRDLGTVRWVGGALFDAPGLAELEAAGLLRAREVRALDDAEEFLIRLRSALHLAVRRRTDRLYREHHPRLAADFGFETTVGLEAPDALMRNLFEHARHVEHTTEAFLERAAARVGAERDDPVDLRAPAAPEEAMEAFAVLAASGGSFAAATLDAIEDADLGEPPFAWTEATRDAFLRILRAGEQGARALEVMDRVGLLTNFFPEWGPVRCRPQRDPYHRFPVDVHLLRTMAESVRILNGASDPVIARAASSVRDRDALLLGAFLHDIGKTGRGSHVRVGGGVARSALARMGVDPVVRERAAFLVEEHLLLADMATRRDLSDEDLVFDVAARVGDPERLAMLYVLTAADAASTGPSAWTAWRQALIRELVGKVQHVLERGDMGPDRAAVLRQRRAAVVELLGADGEPYVGRLPRGYLMGVEPAMVAEHFRLVDPPLGANEARTMSRPGEREGTHDLTVVAADRPGLLAMIAGALALHGLNILSAQAFTTEDGVAIDLFVVEGTLDPLVDEDRWRRVRGDLRRALEGRIVLERRVRDKRAHYPAPAVRVPVRVSVDNDASAFSTVIEVSAADRVGLLFELAAVLHELELTVHVAKVATYEQRVIDAFYVREVAGGKILDPERIERIRRALGERLAALA